ISLSDPVPALYGRDVFKEATGTGMVGLVKQFAGDAWVLGDSSLSGDNPLKLAANVTNVYERDYIAAWEAILDDLELVSFSTVTETVNALDILSRGASPLRGLLTAVVDNTALAAPPSPSAAPPAEKSLKDRVLGDLFSRGKEATGLSEPTPGMLVTAHFQPIHRMMAGEPGNTPLDRVLNRIGEIRQQLGALGPDVGGANPLDVLTSPVLRGMLQSLRQDAASLPPVIENLVSQIGRKAEVSVISGATSELERRYAEDVLRECTDVVEGRFPFSPGSTNDVPLADFGRLLGYDGVFDAFFNQHLAPLVDTSESPWKWRPGAVRPARDILGKFEETQRVREMFFRRGSRSPEMRVTVTLAGVDPSASRFTLEVDGREVLDSRSPGRHNQVIWPGPNPGQTAVTFEDSFSIRHREAVHGAWSWFRLFDGSKRQRETDVRFLLNLQVSGYSARVIVDTSSIHNPLADRSWQRFTCGF
ncbi:MAG: ImcF-related family protein, partial [Vicinamibacterales bacterium]